MEHIADPDLRIVGELLRWIGIVVVVLGSLTVLLLLMIWGRVEQFVSWTKELTKENHDEHREKNG